MKKKYVAFLSIILFLCAKYTQIIFANSGYRYGTEDTMGSLSVERECPILVEKERLIFDLREFPKSQYKSQDEYLSYSGKVSAEYTLYNPTEDTIESTFLLPFGELPSYGEYFVEEKQEYIDYSDTEKYDILVNGNPVDKTLRHSLTTHRWDFEQQDLQFLHNHYVEDDFYTQNMSVTQYTYVAKEVDIESYDSSVVTAAFSFDSSKTKVLVQNLSDNTEDGDEKICLEAVADTGKPYVITVIGEPLERMPEWEFYKDADYTEKINGVMELSNTKAYTFKEFVFLQYDDAKDVSEYDWYNSMLEYMDEFEGRDGVISLIHGFDLFDNLMCWYEYKITIEPKERIINTVTVPVYPEIGECYKPPIYEYSYMLSPNKRWKEFGSLDIVIDTPYYMIESEKDGFEKTDSGYIKHFEELPEEDLYFSLCEKENPHKIYSSNQILLGLTVIMIMVVAVYILIKTLLRKKNK